MHSRMKSWLTVPMCLAAALAMLSVPLAAGANASPERVAIPAAYVNHCTPVSIGEVCIDFDISTLNVRARFVNDVGAANTGSLVIDDVTEVGDIYSCPSKRVAAGDTYSCPWDAGAFFFDTFKALFETANGTYASAEHSY
jgi:hypothetical protein